MSGQVAMDVYMRDPTALRYGMPFIRSFSFLSTGDKVFDNIVSVSIGALTLKPSCSLNWATMESMYAVCERAMVRLGRSRLMWIPSNHFTGPRSMMSKYFHSMVFALAIANGELAVTGISST